MKLTRIPEYDSPEESWRQWHDPSFFRYREDKPLAKEPNCMMMRCLEKNCNTRGILNTESHDFQLKSEHSHGSNKLKVRQKFFMYELVLACRRLHPSAPRKPEYVRLSMNYPDVAAVRPYKSVKSILHRQCKLKVPVLDNIHTFTAYFEAERSGHEEDRLSILYDATVAARDGSVACVFINKELCSKLMESCKEFHTDATFKVVPKFPNRSGTSDLQFSQFLTFHGMFGNKLISFVYVLMTSKTKSLYDAVFQHLRVHMNGIKNESKIMCDFEPAMYKNLEVHFSNCVTVHCLFHYCEAIRRKAAKDGLKPIYSVNEYAWAAMHMVMALAFLKPNRIEIGLEVIEEYWRSSQHDVPENDVMEEFFNYVRTTWIGIVTPTRFSVYNLLHRTNNSLESWHAFLPTILGKHTLPVNFVVQLSAVDYSSVITFDQEMLGFRTQDTASKKYLLNNEAIKSMTQKLESETINILQFLKAVAYRVSTVPEGIHCEIAGNTIPDGQLTEPSVQPRVPQVNLNERRAGRRRRIPPNPVGFDLNAVIANAMTTGNDFIRRRDTVGHHENVGADLDTPENQHQHEQGLGRRRGRGRGRGRGQRSRNAEHSGAVDGRDGAGAIANLDASFRIDPPIIAEGSGAAEDQVAYPSSSHSHNSLQAIEESDDDFGQHDPIQVDSSDDEPPIRRRTIADLGLRLHHTHQNPNPIQVDSSDDEPPIHQPTMTALGHRLDHTQQNPNPIIVTEGDLLNISPDDYYDVYEEQIVIDREMLSNEVYDVQRERLTWLEQHVQSTIEYVEGNVLCKVCYVNASNIILEHDGESHVLCAICIKQLLVTKVQLVCPLCNREPNALKRLFSC